MYNGMTYMVDDMFVEDIDTLCRLQARDKCFYVPPETHVTSRGVERSGIPEGGHMGRGRA
jgi:hypothetical protein